MGTYSECILLLGKVPSSRIIEFMICANHYAGLVNYPTWAFVLESMEQCIQRVWRD